jgi:hypothetical protein
MQIESEQLARVGKWNKVAYPRLTRQVIVKVGCDVELKKLSKFVDDMSWSPILLLLLQIIVVTNDHNELMSQVILLKQPINRSTSVFTDTCLMN